MKRDLTEIGLIVGFVIILGICFLRPYLVYQKYGMEGIRYFIINGRGPMEMEWRNQ